MSDIADLVRRLRKGEHGIPTTWDDVQEAATRLERIAAAWAASRAMGEHKHSCIYVTCEDLRRCIEGHEP